MRCRPLFMVLLVCSAIWLARVLQDPPMQSEWQPIENLVGPPRPAHAYGPTTTSESVVATACGVPCYAEGGSFALSGRVLDEEGRPALAANVRCMRRDRTLLETMTDHEGRYRLTHSGPDPFDQIDLVVTKTGWLTARVPARDILDGRGIVLDYDRRPIADAVVRVRTADGWWDEASCDRSGAFTLMAPVGLLSAEVHSGTHADDAFAQFSFAPGGGTPLEFFLETGVRYQVQFFDCDGAELAGVDACLRTSAGDVVRGCSDADGRIAFSGLAATCATLTAVAPGHAEQIERIDLATNDPTLAVPFMLEPACPWTLDVLHPNGAVMPDAWVSIARGGSEIVAAEAADADPLHVLAAERDYEVTIERAGWQEQRFVLRLAEDGENPVVVMLEHEHPPAAATSRRKCAGQNP